MKPSKKQEIIDVAIKLVEHKGFNSFSFRDLTEVVNIKTSSIHYYFPTKENLGCAIILHYTNEIIAYFNSLGEISDDDKLNAFMGYFEKKSTSDEQSCLIGQLLSEFNTFGEEMKQGIKDFFSCLEEFIAGLILSINRCASKKVAYEIAALIMSSYEGALLTARVFNEPKRVENVELIVKSLIYVKE